MTQDDTIYSSKAESDSVCRIQDYQLFVVESVRKYKIINVKKVLLQTL